MANHLNFAEMNSRKKNSKNGRTESVPDHLRSFVESIVIKDDLDPKERARRALEKKRKQKEEEEARLKQQSKMTNFDEEEIKMLVKQFKMEFPNGNVNKPQASEVIRKIFPRYDADCLLRNIFEIFDNPGAGNGRVTNNDILWVFSMAISGTADEKLQWLFKLYDKDMNGEISQDEMEDIFIKMCKIVEKTEIDHLRKHSKLAEEEKKRQKLALERARERELKKSKDDFDEKGKVSVMYSERKKRLQSCGKKKKPQRKKAVATQIQIVVTDVDEEQVKRDKEKVRALKSVVDELSQPHR